MSATIERPSEKLSSIMPHLVDADIVKSSVRLAERRGEKGADANRERRVGSLLARVERIVDLGGDAKDRVWSSLSEGFLTNVQDIPDTYWEQVKRLSRDNGRGFREWDTDRKDDQIYSIQEAQKLSLEPWRLSLDDSSSYPVWFQIYAMAGLSTMSTFNMEKKRFNRRSKGSTSPYPPCDPSALRSVFLTLEERFGGREIGVDDVDRLVDSGNFNKLYSYFLLEHKTILPLPEQGDDVYGEWHEYRHGDEDKLAAAAIDTPWCTKDPAVAEGYLRYGAPYIPDATTEQPGVGVFYVFHLKDPETEECSDVGVASIRLFNNTVQEISGIEGGPEQFVSRVLVDTVQNKVKTLPGGARYLTAFEDNKRLIAMDRKFSRREQFTVDELKFLYEIDRVREVLDDTYDDIRIGDFKGDDEITMKHISQLIHAKEYQAAVHIIEFELDLELELPEVWKAALEEGLPPNLVLNSVSEESLAELIYPLLSHGYSIDELLWYFSDEFAAKHREIFEKVQDRKLLNEKTRRANVEKIKGKLYKFARAMSGVATRAYYNRRHE